MRHVFIVNPAAGKGKSQKKLVEELEKRQLDFYVTKSAGDCERYVHEFCMKNSGDLRFYACGGDGTLNEVVNGIAEFDHAEAGCVPIGSGNDFIRNFGIAAGDFRNIDRQLAGRAVCVDLIRYEVTDGLKTAGRYAVNMFNIGFDCDVVDEASRIKRYPLVNGSLAYLLSIAVVFIKKRTIKLSVLFDDGTNYEGSVLLTDVSNGCFCGGGIKGSPLAAVDDGLIDVCIVKDMPRNAFLSLASKYARGTYLQDRRAEGLILYKKCEKVTVKPQNGNLRICADGDISAFDYVKFEAVKKKLRFSLPK